MSAGSMNSKHEPAGLQAGVETGTAAKVGMVTLVMLFSRLLSLVSVQIYMAVFGAGGNEINIYSFALPVPNILFTSFGTALATVVIPIYSGLLSRGEKSRADRFAHNLFTSASLFTLGLILISELAAPLIPGLTEYSQPDRGSLFLVQALRILFPVMMFYTWNYILQGLLQSAGRFFMPAFVSVPSSLIVIGYTLLLGSRFGVQGLLVATVLGLSTQAFILIPPILKLGYRYRPVMDLKDPDMVKALKLSPSVLLGTSAYQLNMLFNSILAANFGNKVTLLNFAQALVLNSVLAFVYSMTAVIYPRLSVQHARGDKPAYLATVTGAVRSIAFLLIPATAGLIAVREPLLDLLVRWGRVTGEEARLAASLLAFYTAGILGIGLKEVFDRAFYAAHDTRTPAINGIFMMVVNIGASLLFTSFMGIQGIPLAYSVAAAAGGLALALKLHRKTGGLIDPKLIKGFGTMALAGLAVYAASAATVHLTGLWLETGAVAGGGAETGAGVLVRILRVGLPVLAGGLAYAGITIAFRLAEAQRILLKIRSVFHHGSSHRRER
ncbi:MAG TPA: murein biosynthesis integral membrane protein MurJ [Clostridiales bacterium]|nr:murein biosynthesis integral membrane protein MurJ [Clostridiales bacterium]